jgi:flagellar protein FliS
MQSGDELYREMVITTEIETASPHRQIQMLLEKCLQHMQQASYAIVAQDVIKKGRFISKAINIIAYLRTCLDINTIETKELASNLYRIYEYSERRLLQANIHSKVEYINEVYKILENIKDSWDKIG